MAKQYKCEIAPFRNIAAESCHSVAPRICLTLLWAPFELGNGGLRPPPLYYYCVFSFKQRKIIELGGRGRQRCEA